MRLIDADALEELFREGIRHIAKRPEIDDSLERLARASAMVIEIIKDMPTVDTVPVRHGRWLKGGYVCGETEWICSVCGETEWRTNCNRMKYCMFCGAKMDEGEDDG